VAQLAIQVERKGSMMHEEKRTAPLVSILVVTYNQESYIAQTLDSLLNQRTSFPYEILVGEDHSTDRTRIICKDYATRYPDKIRLFFNESNKGFIPNYFGLFPYAKGQYLADCGGDDYWLTVDRLQKQVDWLEAHPEAGMVCGNWSVYYEATGQLVPDGLQIDTKEIPYDPGYYGPEAVIRYLNDLNDRGWLCRLCFRAGWIREAMDTYPNLFTGPHVICEDIPITLFSLMRGPIGFIKEPFAVYRVREESISHSVDKGLFLKNMAWRSFRQTLELATALELEINHLTPYIHRYLPDFMIQAFQTEDKSWMRQIRQTAQQHGIPFTLKQYFLFSCLQSRLTAAVFPWLYRKVKRYRHA
jgi:glycosyltransferase involved in cell wall biosynthesis